MTLSATFTCGMCNGPVDVEKAVILGDVPFHEPCAYKYLDEFDKALKPTRGFDMALWMYIAIAAAFVVATAAALGIAKLWW